MKCICCGSEISNSTKVDLCEYCKNFEPNLTKECKECFDFTIPQPYADISKE